MSAVKGLEPSTFSLGSCSTDSQGDDIATTCEGASETPNSSHDSSNATEAELKQLIAAWPSLPEPVRAGILAMVAATSTSVGS